MRSKPRIACLVLFAACVLPAQAQTPRWYDVELVLFRQKQDARASDVAQMLHGYTAEMNKFDTLLYRTVAHDGNGGWTCINYWTTADAMKTLNADAQTWPSLKRFPELVDMSTLQLITYEIDRR